MSTSVSASAPALSTPVSKNAQAVKGSPKSLSGLLPFLRPYRVRIALALLFLTLQRVQPCCSRWLCAA